MAPRMLFALLLLIGPTELLATPGKHSHFRGQLPGDVESAIEVTKVESSLQTAIEEVLGLAHGGKEARRFRAIEASMWPTFQAVPKSDRGRLEPRAVRHLIRSFFSKEHGWHIHGLEGGEAFAAGGVHEVAVLQAKVPGLVEAMLEARENGYGLSLSNVVAMATALERLIMDDSVTLLLKAYELQSAASAMPLPEMNLSVVLLSYLSLYTEGVSSNITSLGFDASQHYMSLQAQVADGSIEDYIHFSQDAMLDYNYAHKDVISPFEPRQYSFQATSSIVDQLLEGFGSWQHQDCEAMRSDLVSLDMKKTGRIPLDVFRSRDETYRYAFTETDEQLREVGALDETIKGQPSVIIANYISSPTNCLTHSNYYSICCRSASDVVMSELEDMLRRPSVPAAALLAAVKNVSLASDDFEESATTLFGGHRYELEKRLNDIATHHGGEVPLHGRLFAQWLHFAFPRHCPHPLEASSLLQAEEAEATTEGFLRSSAKDSSEKEVGAPRWVEEEVLLLVEEAPRSRWRLLGPLMPLVAVCGIVARLARDAWGASAPTLGMVASSKGQKSHLP